MSEQAPLRISRRTALKWGALAAAAPAVGQIPLDVFAGGQSESVVIAWNNAALQGVRDSKIGPPMVARALAIVHTCAYDAWAAYDDHAVGTQLGGSLRRPHPEHTRANTAKAISFAAYRAAVDLFPGDTTSVFDPLMVSLGYDPSDTTTDVTTPSGVGNVAARAVLDFRRTDGANQPGNYADYTGFKPVNDPMDVRVGHDTFDRGTVHDPNQWQPLRYATDPAGLNVVTPSFVGAQWQHVAPFALTSAAQLRSSTGPAKYGSDAYVSQAQAVLQLSAGLTDQQKMIAEFWADGPRSELPPGHWDLFAQFVSRRDHHGADRPGLRADIKLFFALTNAILDASICCWDNKRTFDGVRPITAIRYLFQGQMVSAWGGPYQGTKLIPGETWFPYQPRTFPTPPFPGYSSGHSTFSAAGATILRLFTGSERFGASVSFPAGSSRVEPGTVPRGDLTLRWATFREAADQAGLSRRYGGIHFEQDDLDARAAGRLIAKQAWKKARSYFRGTGDEDDGDDKKDNGDD